MAVFRTNYARSRILKADTRRLSVESVLTFPTHDLAGDWVVPEGLDFSLHEQDPSIDLEHARTHIKGYPVAWARESLGKPGAPYAVEMVPLNCAGEGEPEEWHTLPVGTSYFDPSDRIGSQTFALVEQGALPAVSLEFQTVPGAFTPLGRSPLENRPAYHFEKASVLKWTLCAVPVNPGALHVAKSVSLVPLSLAQVLQDGRVNVGGRWEPLHPVIRKALSGTAAAPRMQIDNCPECGERFKAQCRCMRNDRWCKNRHTWEVLSNGSPVLLDGGHGKVVKTYDGSSTEDAEKLRKTFSFYQPEQKAMEPDDEFDGNMGDADLETQDDAMFADAVDDEPAHAGVQTLYDLADQLTETCERAKQGAKATENPEIYRALMKLCDKVEALASEAGSHGDKHDAKLMAMKTGSDAGSDEEHAEPDGDEGDDPEMPSDNDGDAESDMGDDDEGDGKKKPPFKKARRAVYLKAVPRPFKKSEVEAGKSRKKKAVDDVFAAAKRVFG